MARRSNRTLVTLFTDASWMPSNSTGSWAYWAKKDGGSVTGGGQLRPPVASSNEAEFKAVANALQSLVDRDFLLARMHVLIQTDSQHVIRYMQQTSRFNPKLEERIAQLFILKLATTVGFSFSFRHVKGHQSDGGPRGYVNRLCDGLARRHLRKDPPP